MNARIATSAAAVVLALLGSSAALAQQAPLSRADVVAGVLQARANGTLNSGELEYSLPTDVVSTRSRADVKAELLQARADGSLPGVGDSYGYKDLGEAQPVNSTVSRAAVKADVRAALHSGKNLGSGELG